MFKIDLLKGQGLPMKSSPGGIAIAAVTVAVPMTIAIIMFGFYLNDRTHVSIKEQEIVRCQAEIDKLSGAVEQQDSLEKEKIVYGNYLSEVKSSISRYIQWSPVLVTLVENMPDSVMLTELEVMQHSVRKKVPNKDNPQEMVEKNVPVRILRMSVSGSPQHDCDKAVRDFRNHLRSSAFLGPKLENIGVSQESETLEGRDVASYEIECVFKARL
jgi:Tfp pilus assembly protein PilN